MKKLHLTARWILMITVILFWTVGCGLLALNDQEFSSEEEIQTQVAETMIAMHAAETLVAQGEIPAPDEADLPSATISQAEMATATITPSPTITNSPTITLTSTLEVPMASVSENTNCRTGPDKIYDNIGALMVGEQAEVVGQTADGGYWVIKNPDRSGECWLWGYYATVTGPTDSLLVYTPPPTPTPAFVWAGTWLVTNNPPFGFTLTVVTDGRDFAANVDRGGVIITYTGTISDDYLSVSGTWMENPEETGPFKLYAMGTNQFNGNIVDRDMTQGLCGLRGGAGLPSPCYRP